MKEIECGRCPPITKLWSSICAICGLSRSSGNAVVCMDADLQHPTHVIIQLIEEWRKGRKVVNTIRIDPDDFSLLKRATAHLYYKIFSYLSGVKLKNGMADFRLLDGRS